MFPYYVHSIKFTCLKLRTQRYYKIFTKKFIKKAIYEVYLIFFPCFDFISLLLFNLYVKPGPEQN